MNDYSLSVVASSVKWLGIATFFVAAYVRNRVWFHKKPAHDDFARYVAPPLPKYYTPRGMFLFRVSVWLRAAAVAMMVVWYFFLRPYQ